MTGTGFEPRQRSGLRSNPFYNKQIAKQFASLLISKEV